ncbi:MAG: glycoside hydrolase family 2 TIM barrel-domain containing protein [Calditrichaceae bacterium]
MRPISKYIICLSLICFLYSTHIFSNPSNEKQIQYLSGSDNLNTVKWDFYCTDGRKSGYWTKIEVPSQWEQQGFGSYNYGRDYHTYGPQFKYADEQGLYKHTFSIPESWCDKEIFIVFEGSMTDTEVKINGTSAGEIHQGAFYRFKYNITDLIYLDKPNLLEVTVSKMSSNESVNRAERYADYWIFGGIFRPVYLEAYPCEYIEQIAIAAYADGSLKVKVSTKNIIDSSTLVAEIFDSENHLIKTISEKINKDNSEITLKTKIENPSLWSSETPALYKVKLCLKRNSGVLYQTSEKFGFRTIEVKPNDGIYINGQKIKMKGINRHVFWPETGRCMNKSIDLMDVKLIKEMNMNAVRCSHYPPDQSFLYYCDSLGLYVLDELAGWHNAYDTKVGEKLVREMVIRDVNHPSIIFWSNGNEGGTNKELDDDFSKYDPSNRTVIHAHHKPGNVFNYIDTNHYEKFYGIKQLVEKENIYMPTEFLHSQYDGGGGAGLYDIWELMWNSDKSGGGFIWALLDEGIVRTDLGWSIDVNAVNAPDGILGPHREKEGSFNAIKQIFSPVHIDMKGISESFEAAIPVENRFDFTNLNQCIFDWKLVKFRKPNDLLRNYVIIDNGSGVGADIEPHASGNIKLSLPENWRDAEALLLTAIDPSDKDIYTWSWKIQSSESLTNSFINLKGNNVINIDENDTLLTLVTNDNSISFNKISGLLTSVNTKIKNRSRKIHFNNGPVFCAGNSSFIGLRHYQENGCYVVESSYQGGLKTVRWKLYQNGWLEMTYSYELFGKYDFSGISFDYPEEFVLSAKWLGNGPYRVWKNRMQGVTFNIWENSYNNTFAGTAPWQFPEFKGYFSDIAWMEINTVEGRIFIASKQDDLFVRLFDFYALRGLEKHPVSPTGDISFLDYIPPIGTQMSTRISAQPAKLGPSSEMNKIEGEIKRTLYFYFGELK